MEEFPKLQAIISTHSSYIVSNSQFEDIRYILKNEDDVVEIKNFHTDLASLYKKTHGVDGAILYKFIEQYLKIQNAELFFADKAIFIEGVTERKLLPLFVKAYDKSCSDPKKKINSQNISIIDAGAK